MKRSPVPVRWLVERTRQAMTLDLAQRGSSVTGTGVLGRGEADGAVPVAVRGTVARGGAFRLTLVATGAGSGAVQVLAGDWFRDEMSGTTTRMGAGSDRAHGSGMFEGRRTGRSPTRSSR